jgi:hypothetical protein
VNGNLQEWLFQCKKCHFRFCSTDCQESRLHSDVCQFFAALPPQILNEDLVEVIELPL